MKPAQEHHLHTASPAAAGMPATPLPSPPRTSAGVPPEIALDAVGPVLETVLQNLTAVGAAERVDARLAGNCSCAVCLTGVL